jgi:hypothetical protein
MAAREKIFINERPMEILKLTLLQIVALIRHKG